MLVFRITGSLMIIAASSLIGYIYSKDSAKRPQELRTIQALLQMFENEISFLSNVLAESFERIYKSNDGTLSDFFKGTVINLQQNKGISAATAWEKSIKENLNKTSLSKEDAEILLNFGKILGSSDLEGQIKNIRLTINQLKIQEQKAEESRKKNEAMYRNLGILGGIALVIILI